MYTIAFLSIHPLYLLTWVAHGVLLLLTGPDWLTGVVVIQFVSLLQASRFTGRVRRFDAPYPPQVDRLRRSRDIAVWVHVVALLTGMIGWFHGR